jgi:hypothetical protein
MLPEEADEAIAWANRELRERNMPQTVILDQFNAMLADKAIKGVSKSAFSRYSMRKAREIRRLEQGRKLAEAVLANVDPSDRSAQTVAIAELAKQRVLGLMLDAEDGEAVDLKELTLALNRLSTIDKRDAELRRAQSKHDREEEDRIAAEQKREREEAAEQVEKIGAEAGLGAESIAAIRKGVLGIG